MGQTIVLTGMVLAAIPIGDYDKRITILTRERGKITAFAKGAKRQGSALAAAANPFAFGEFEVYEGRTSYTVVRAGISNYFRELLEDFEGVYYGFYFLEVADYYARENNDELPMLKLLYQSLRALLKESLPNRLVRCIYECKAMVINGEYPDFFSCGKCGRKEGLAWFWTARCGMLCSTCKDSLFMGMGGGGNDKPSLQPYGGGNNSPLLCLEGSALYALQYIVTAKIEKLYTFTVSEEVLGTLEGILEEMRKRFLDKTFKSLDVLEENRGFAHFYPNSS